MWADRTDSRLDDRFRQTGLPLITVAAEGEAGGPWVGGRGWAGVHLGSDRAPEKGGDPDATLAWVLLVGNGESLGRRCAQTTTAGASSPTFVQPPSSKSRPSPASRTRQNTRGGVRGRGTDARRPLPFDEKWTMAARHHNSDERGGPTKDGPAKGKRGVRVDVGVTGILGREGAKGDHRQGATSSRAGSWSGGTRTWTGTPVNSPSMKEWACVRSSQRIPTRVQRDPKSGP